MSKAKILNNITKALQTNPLSNEKGSYRDIIIPVETDKIQEYKRLQTLNKAEIFESKGIEGVREILEEIFAKEGITQTLISRTLQEKLSIPTLVYDKPIEELKEELFKIECGIVEADYGVANLGVVALTSSPIQPRLLSLITKHCIILLDHKKIVANLSEALQNIKASHPEVLPSNILFIAGPSRTADIELQVVFGVHGPQKTYVILY